MGSKFVSGLHNCVILCSLLGLSMWKICGRCSCPRSEPHDRIWMIVCGMVDSSSLLPVICSSTTDGTWVLNAATRQENEKHPPRNVFPGISCWEQNCVV